VRIMNVGSGKSSPDSSRNVGDVGGQNTVAKSVRKVRGCIIDTGALQRSHELFIAPKCVGVSICRRAAVIFILGIILLLLML